MSGVSDHLDAACGRCGYSTRGLTTMVCPECGSDLRVVGIRAARTVRASRWSFVFGALVATALLAVVAAGTGRAVVELLPVVKTWEQRMTLVSATSRRTFDVAARAQVWTDQRPEMPVTLTLRTTPSAGPLTLTYYPGGGYAYRGAGGREVRASNGFGREVVRAWMRDAAGLDMRDTAIDDEATVLAAAARNRSRPMMRVIGRGDVSRSMVGGGGAAAAAFPMRSVTTTEVATGELPPGAMIVFGGVWFVVWLACLRFLWRQRAR